MKTVLEHLQSIEDSEAKEKALSNIDTRYQNDLVHTLTYAIMLAVYQNTEEDKKFWKIFQSELNSSKNKNLYQNQIKQISK